MFKIVVNPAGASGRTLKKWKSLEHLFQESGEAYKVYYSTMEHGITDIMKEITSNGEKNDIVIVGGDGTMNQAVNGIIDFTTTRIGFISCGSGNDLARSLKLTEKAEENIGRILQKNTVRKINIGETVYYDRHEELEKEIPSSDGLIHRRFTISSGIGFDAAICQQVAVSKMKKVLNKIYLGKLSYINVAIRIITHTPRVSSTVILDGKEMELKKMLSCVAMNEPYEGGGFMFCPHAKDNDDILGLCTVDGITQAQFFQIFPFAYNGNHLKFDGIQEVSGKEIEIKTEEPLWIHTDGEVTCKSKHIKIHLINEKMMMLN